MRAPWSVLAAVGLLAFLLRLLPWLRGGGLWGLGRYDDGVYFAAAVALVHGRLPYRDFLLLHPPGVVVALSPFAALGLVAGEGNGLAAARVAWLLLGAVNAALVARIVLPVGLFGAALGGSCYAVFLPALNGELGTQLQAPANTCLLVALWLLSVAKGGDPLGPPSVAKGGDLREPPGPAKGGASPRVVLVAGLLLGLAVTVKVWGAVALLLLAGWLLFSSGARRALLLVLGAALGATVVCLPFFLAAPVAMWQQVVTAQISRSRFDPDVVLRLVDITGLRLVQPEDAVTPLVVLVLLGLATATLLAWSEPIGRPAVILLLGLGLVLLTTPPWFPFYPALTAPAVALVVGVGGQRLMRLVRQGGRAPSWVAATALLLVVAAYAHSSSSLAFGRRFDGSALGAAVASLPGCVTSDTPAALVEMDVLGRNIERGCPLVVDPGGYSYLLHPDQGNITRHLDPDWQDLVLGYLRSGNASIVATYRNGSGFSAATVAEIERWPTIAQSGAFRVRAPLPADG